MFPSVIICITGHFILLVSCEAWILFLFMWVISFFLLFWFGMIYVFFRSGLRKLLSIWLHFCCSRFSIAIVINMLPYDVIYNIGHWEIFEDSEIWLCDCKNYLHVWFMVVMISVNFGATKLSLKHDSLSNLHKERSCTWLRTEFWYMNLQKH